MSLFKDVGEFHRKFLLPEASETSLLGGVDPCIVAPTIFEYRKLFLEEEHEELKLGYGEGDLAKIADALADIVWVALGTAHYFGIPFDAVWAEVRRANMEKRPWREGDPVKRRAHRYTAGEIVKPADWRPPEIERVLSTWGYVP